MSKPLCGNRFWKLLTSAFRKLVWAEIRDIQIIQSFPLMQKYSKVYRFFESFYNSTMRDFTGKIKKWSIKPCSKECPSITPSTGACSICWDAAVMSHSQWNFHSANESSWGAGKYIYLWDCTCTCRIRSCFSFQGRYMWGNSYRLWFYHQNLLVCYSS